MSRFIFPIFLLLLLNACFNNSNNQKNFKTSYLVKPDSIEFKKHGELLDEDKYWQIIEKSLKGGIGYNYKVSKLLEGITKLSPKEIIGFRLRTTKLLKDSYKSDLWCAAYIMNGGCSDDGFEYFRCWLICQGKEIYQEAVKNPDVLVKTSRKFLSNYEFEPFLYLTDEVFLNNTGKEIYEYVDIDKFFETEGNYPQIEFTWQEDNPESMKKICPKVFKKFW